MSLQLSLLPNISENLSTKVLPNWHVSKAESLGINRTAAEYFAGIGLVRLGLERAGWNVIFANDIAAEKYEMYSSYFQDAPEHYRLGDIFELDVTSIPETVLATSSFPCIDLSLAGNQNGLAGKHSGAFWGFIRILREQGEKRPRLVMLENVSGWLTSNKGLDFRLTIQALNELGYACDVYALDAIRFSPQSRPRIFVIGVQLDKPNKDWGRLLERSPSLSTATLKNAVKVNYDLNWHFCLPAMPPPKRNSGLSLIIEEMDEQDSRWWNQAEVERHLSMMSISHRNTVDKLARQTEISYRTIYRRIRNKQQRAEVRGDDIAGCLRTARGGSSRQIVIAMGLGTIKMRHMTPREYARLQGVPDNYPIPPNNIQALTGFGDAVCVPVITWLAEQLLDPLLVECAKE